MSEGIDKTKSKRDNIVMSGEAWDYLENLKMRQTTLPIRGRGRIVEDFLLKEKAKEEKKKPADKQPAA